MHFFVQDWDNLYRAVFRMYSYQINEVGCRSSWLGGYLLNMSETISTSVSAAAIFSAEESWGRPPKRKDMLRSVQIGFL